MSETPFTHTQKMRRATDHRGNHKTPVFKGGAEGSIWNPDKDKRRNLNELFHKIPVNNSF